MASEKSEHLPNYYFTNGIMTMAYLYIDERLAMATIELEYSGIRHTLIKPDALTPAFDGTLLKEQILAILPKKASWELEGRTVDAVDDGISDYGVRFGNEFMPVFFWDDLNTVEYNKGTVWGKLALQVLALMESSAEVNALALGVKPEKLQHVEPLAAPIDVYEIDFEWKF